MHHIFSQDAWASVYPQFIRQSIPLAVACTKSKNAGHALHSRGKWILAVSPMRLVGQRHMCNWRVRNKNELSSSQTHCGLWYNYSVKVFEMLLSNRIHSTTLLTKSSNHHQRRQTFTFYSQHSRIGCVVSGFERKRLVRWAHSTIPVTLNRNINFIIECCALIKGTHRFMAERVKLYDYCYNFCRT